MRIDRQRFSIVYNRIIIATYFHQQLGIRVVRIGIVRNKLNVFLKRLFRFVILFHKPVYISQQIIRRREFWIDFYRLLIFLFCLIILLNSEIVSAEQVVSPFIVRKSRN